MTVYNDYSYIKYLCGCCYEKVLEIYNTVINEKNETRNYSLFLAEFSARNYIGSYNDYKKRQQANYKNKNMSKKDKKKIEERTKKKEENIKKYGTRVNIDSLL